MQPFIRNASALRHGEARDLMLRLIETALASIRTENVLSRAVELSNDTLRCKGVTYNLQQFDRLVVCAVGKAAFTSALALETILGDRITDGIAIDVSPPPTLSRIRVYQGSHPYPSAENETASLALLHLLESLGERDLVLTVISGGGSALLTAPFAHTVGDEVALVKALFAGGATIQELNTVRKHISKVRGGALAVAAHPATHMVMVMSDVPGDDLSFIASGPTVRDTTTLSDACNLLKRYNVEHMFPCANVRETPKDSSLFSTTCTELVLTNHTALEAMRDVANKHGYSSSIVTAGLTGEARVVASRIVRELRSSAQGTVLLYGGETTVTARGHGVGGRNEELALAALLSIEENELVVSLASDGRDNTAYAGGIADRYTKAAARTMGLDPISFLERNDSFTFFHTLQQGIDVGYTGSNIADLVIAIKARSA